VIKHFYIRNAEKLLTLSQSIEKLQHFEISFDGKKKKNSDF
jgi:3-methyladenine DNA glycosylase Tag